MCQTARESKLECLQRVPQYVHLQQGVPDFVNCGSANIKANTNSVTNAVTIVIKATPGYCMYICMGVQIRRGASLARLGKQHFNRRVNGMVDGAPVREAKPIPPRSSLETFCCLLPKTLLLKATVIPARPICCNSTNQLLNQPNAGEILAVALASSCLA